ncbi:MAG: XTP/dITP diphosphatase [Elusimicrobiota bacterium]
MKLFLATGNRDKIKEISAILPFGKFSLETCLDHPDMPEVKEDGATLLENSEKKAMASASYFNMPAVADDTGLEVHALGGAPGVYSARWAGEGCTYLDNNLKLLKELEKFSDSERQARFVCVITLAFPEGKRVSFEGVTEGIIARKPTGTAGFGYDPLFFVPEFGLTYAEMGPELKNRISHRAKALAKLKEYLEDLE